MVVYLKEMAGAADRVAAGDLSVSVQPRSERDALGTALSGMVDEPARPRRQRQLDRRDAVGVLGGDGVHG